MANRRRKSWFLSRITLDKFRELPARRHEPPPTCLRLPQCRANATAFRIYSAGRQEAAPVREVVHLPGWRQRLDCLVRAVFPDLDNLPYLGPALRSVACGRSLLRFLRM